MSTDQVTVDREDGRVTITLDRPEKLNVLTTEIFDAIGEAIDDCDPGTTDVVTVRGAGGNFSAGVDMSNVPEWIEQTPLEVRETLESIHDTLRAIEGLDVPVVAAIEGHCLGGALELAISCDIRIATEDASFGLPESKLGLAMNYGGAQKLPGFVGEGLTKHMIMTGDPIDAERAHSAGLVEELHAEEEFEDALADLQERLAEKPTYVHGFAKRQVHSARPSNLEEAMNLAIYHAVSGYQEPETQRLSLDFLE